MRIKLAAAIGLGLFALGACSSSGSVDAPVGLGPNRDSRGSELVNNSVRVETATGATSTMYFAADGNVRANFSGRTTAGRWAVEGTKLCFTWGPVKDCWPYPAPFRKGETRTVTSDRGNTVKVTLL